MTELIQKNNAEYLNKLIATKHSRDFFKIYAKDPIWDIIEKDENGRSVQLFNRLSTNIWKSNSHYQDNIIRVSAMLFISRNDHSMTQAKITVQNIIKLIKGYEQDTQDSVEEVIFSMTQFIPPHVFDYIWHDFVVTRENRRLILMNVLATLATGGRKHIQPLIPQLLKIIGDPRACTTLKAETVRTIANLGTQRNNIVGEIQRLPATHDLFSAIERFILTEFLDPERNTSFFPIMRNILLIYFNISSDTSTLVINLLKKMMKYAKDDCEQSLAFGRALRGRRRKEIRIRNKNFYYNNLNTVYAERILSTIGEVALRIDVFTEMFKPSLDTRFPMFISQFLSKEFNNNAAAKVNITDLEYRYVRRIGEVPILVTKDADDMNNSHFFEQKRRMEHRERMEQEFIIPHLIPFVRVLMNSDNMSVIKVASYICVSKLMLLNKEIAHELAPIYFTALDSEHQITRKNFLISLGDVCFRVPELIRKHASEIYAMVLDKDMGTKVTCMVIVSHLVRFSRLDVTEEATEFAKCLIHDSELIRRVSGSFFANIEDICLEPLVPMMLGRLAMKHFNVEKYRQLLRVLFNYIPRSKSSEILHHMFDEFELLKGIAKTEKNEKVPEYLSYVISQLYITKQAMRDIRENVESYRPFLKSKRFLYDIILPLQRLIKSTHKPELADEGKALQRDLRAIHKKMVSELPPPPRQKKCHSRR